MSQGSRFNLFQFYERVSMRTRIGIAAFVLLTIAAITYGCSLLGSEKVHPFAATFLVGVPLFFLWLAWPDIARFPRWVLHAMIPLTIVVAIWPRLLCVFIPFVLLLLFLQPKKKKK